ncbi:hypothetical protein ANCDUO_14061 [Ancylostoma duodenale]|uniref:SHSP domain-containing protein n=1 Tax=Ancylostoma duodenale TaxID=51022 RepID=A0A0C2GF68_9BILA|nr:hypothetical protein ANCDUO_14061 [Ancylostoma duodenale]
MKPQGPVHLPHGQEGPPQYIRTVATVIRRFEFSTCDDRQPFTSILPRLRFYDDLFDEFDHFERALRPLPRFSQDGLSDKVTNDETKLAISVAVPQFKPEELKVGLDGRTLTVEGKQELKEEGAYSMSYVFHQALGPSRRSRRRADPILPH